MVADMEPTQVTVVFTTELKEPEYQLETQHDYVVQSLWTKADLNELLVAELNLSDIKFEFKTTDGTLLTGSIQEFLESTNRTTEDVIALEYILAWEAPEPELVADTPSPILLMGTLSHESGSKRIYSICTRGNLMLYKFSSKEKIEVDKTLKLESDVPDSLLTLPSLYSDVICVISTSGLIEQVTSEGLIQTVAKVALPDPVACASLNGKGDAICIGTSEGALTIHRTDPSMLFGTHELEVASTGKRSRGASTPIRASPVTLSVHKALGGAHRGGAVTGVRFYERPAERLFAVLSTGMDGIVLATDYIGGEQLGRIDTGKSITCLDLIEDLVIVADAQGAIKTYKVTLSDAAVKFEKLNQQSVCERAITHLIGDGQTRILVTLSDENKICVCDPLLKSGAMVTQSLPAHAGLRPEFPLFPTAGCWVERKVLAIGSSQNKLALIRY